MPFSHSSSSASVDHVLEPLHDLEQLGRLVLLGHLDKGLLAVQHRLEAHVLEPVGEDLDVRGADAAGLRRGGDARQVAQGSDVPEQRAGRTGVHPQLGAHPRRCRRRPVELEVLRGLQLAQQRHLRRVQRVLGALHRAELLAHVAHPQRRRGPAHRVDRGFGAHVVMLLEHVFEDTR
jgi:hypothetical protein